MADRLIFLQRPPGRLAMLTARLARPAAWCCGLLLLARLVLAAEAPIYDPPASQLLPPAQVEATEQQLALRREGLDNGRQALAARNFAAARHWLWIAAEQGDGEGQFLLAGLYRRGLGVERNVGIASDWLRQSALQGHVAAQNALGELFRDGEGVDNDDHEAAWWLRRAADQGFAAAQTSLGEMILQQRVAGQDAAAATAWFQQAAGQNFPAAQYQLGVSLAEGRGIAADDVLARRWLGRAAAAGHAPARAYLHSLDAGETPPAAVAERTATPAIPPEN
jgi:TPR repeat protein